jgi:hypothetical protein
VGLLVLLVPKLACFRLKGADRGDHNTGFNPHYTQEKFKLTKKLFPGMLNDATGNFASFPIFQSLKQLDIDGLTVDLIWLRLPHLQALTIGGEIQVPHIPKYIEQLEITTLTVHNEPCLLFNWASTETVGTENRREKVVVLRELQRGIIYTRELSKQAIEAHVSTTFMVYSVNEGARLTETKGLAFCKRFTSLLSNCNNLKLLYLYHDWDDILEGYDERPEPASYEVLIHRIVPHVPMLEQLTICIQYFDPSRW